MVSLLLIFRLIKVRPTAAPPTRKKTSCSEMGSLSWRALLPSGPISSRAGDCTGPASNNRPARMIPSASAVVIAGGAVNGPQRGEADPHHHGIGPGYVDCIRHVVDARGQQ